MNTNSFYVGECALCAGDGVRGGGVCSNLPVFFSQNSGLVAVVGRESASILPETMEDSLCSSLAAAPEVLPVPPHRLLVFETYFISNCQA